MRKRGYNTYTVYSKHIYFNIIYEYISFTKSYILRIYLEYEIQFLITTT